ncbi:protein takeout [Leptinotarsa decemlineata]|uniref:protein takeout n=1 Tax=Leptinotarsa decemlineata TaxID=7539 RepID=UPI000C2551AF|nr:protein takeout-like [Leptinotarsa decemlineata]
MFQKIFLCITFIQLSLLEITISTPKLPTYFKICHKSDPDLGKCIKRSVEELRPLLTKGIPELNIPSCEPLCIPEVVIDQGTGSVALKSVYKDIKVYGPSKFVIKQIKVDLEKNKMRMKVWLPHLEVICTYTMDGKILMMPISGTGLSRANYSDIEATVTLRTEKIKKDGELYYNVKDFYVNFDIGHAQIFFEDLFNGDKDLGEAMNLFINDNWKQVANEIKPVLEDHIAAIFKKFANKIFHKYPIKTILPE